MSQPSPITHALKPTASLQAAEVTSDRRKRKRKHREEDFAANSTLNHHIPHITQLDGDPQEKTKNRKKHKHRVLPLLDDPPTNLDSTSDTLANPLTVSKLSSDAESREERKARKKREKALRFSSTTAGEEIVPPVHVHAKPSLVSSEIEASEPCAPLEALKPKKKKKRSAREEGESNPESATALRVHDQTPHSSGSSSSVEPFAGSEKTRSETSKRKSQDSRHADPARPSVESDPDAQDDASSAPAKKTKKRIKHPTAEGQGGTGILEHSNPQILPTEPPHVEESSEVSASKLRPSARRQITQPSDLDTLASGSTNDLLRAINGLSKPRNPASGPSVPPAQSSLIRKAAKTSKKLPEKGSLRRDDANTPSSGVEPVSTASDSIRCSKWLTPDELIAQGIPIKKGQFSQAEGELVADAMKSYCREQGLSHDQLIELIFTKGKSRATSSAFYSYITERVPERTMTAVYNYVKRRYNPMATQGPWTADEDAALAEAHAGMGPQWEKISAEVGRTAGDCRDRYRNHLKDKESRNHGAWTVEEDDKLREIIQSITIKRGKDDMARDIFWTTVSDRMGGMRSRQQCCIRWQDALVKQEAAHKDVRWSKRETFLLVDEVSKLQGLKRTSEINWRTLVENAKWNPWSAHETQRKWRLLEGKIPNHDRLSFTDVVQALKETHPTLPKLPKFKQREGGHEAVIIKSKEMVDDDSDSD